MKRILAIVIGIALCLSLTACGSGYDPLEGVATQQFTDSAGRDVMLPQEITRVAASGSTAQMILMTIAPELLIGLASSPSAAQMPYFPEDMWYLPTFGQIGRAHV